MSLFEKNLLGIAGTSLDPDKYFRKNEKIALKF